MGMRLQTEIDLEVIADFLSAALPPDWKDWGLDRRREFWQSDRTVGTIRRNRVTALEIWQELFGYEKAFFNQHYARQINNLIRQVPYWLPSSSVDCGPLYGRQRGFVFDVLAEQRDQAKGVQK